MKKYSLSIAAIIICGFAIRYLFAQTGGAVVQTSTGAPTGACISPQADMDTVTGNLWTCKAGVWVMVGSPNSVPLRGTTGTITGTLLALGACNTGTATVTGATTAMQATASPVSDPGPAVVWHAWVSSTNTVTVKECELILGTPNNTAFNVTVNP